MIAPSYFHRRRWAPSAKAGAGMLAAVQIVILAVTVGLAWRAATEPACLYEPGSRRWDCAGEAPLARRLNETCNSYSSCRLLRQGGRYYVVLESERPVGVSRRFR